MFGYSKDEQRKLDHCLYCFEAIHKQETLFHYLSKDDVLCASCRDQMKLFQKTITIQNIKIYGIYIYDDYLEKLFFQYKEARDIALSEIFMERFKDKIQQKYRKHTWVFMPSSQEKYQERGFYPLEEIFKNYKVKKASILYKKYDYKQSKQGLEARKRVKDIIKVKEHEKIKTKILLVDDVCTSGESIKIAYQLLKDQGYQVDVLVIAIHQMHMGGKV